ncbi:phage integrase SAM-like domain-containing protein [Parabacteroides faecis]|uniref:phage integrase SAM-like domain-containing protein n=1 Tax=Parabacteroides faecis TaxID=1217282 RepID=UPI0035AF7241
MDKDKTQNNDKTPKSKLLIKAFEEQVKIKTDLGRERTAKNYRTTIAKIKTYLSEQSDSDSNNRNGNGNGNRPLPTLRLRHIDTQWVQDFTAWLYRQHPDTPGTAGFYLSNFKAMYNHTVEQGQVTYPDSGYPFAHVSIKSPVPFKRALPQKEVQRLSERNLYAQLTPRLPRLPRHLPIYLLLPGYLFPRPLHTHLPPDECPRLHYIYTQ